jgi:hypothetical protein
MHGQQNINILDKYHTQLGEMVKWQHFGPLHADSAKTTYNRLTNR